MGAIGGAIGNAPGDSSNLGGDLGLTKVPIIGGMFSDPNDREKVSDLSQQGLEYQQRRPLMAEARNQALQNQSTAYQGASDALASMYGARGGAAPAGLSRQPGANIGPNGSESLYTTTGNPRYSDQFGSSGIGSTPIQASFALPAKRLGGG